MILFHYFKKNVFEICSNKGKCLDNLDFLFQHFSCCNRPEGTDLAIYSQFLLTDA